MVAAKTSPQCRRYVFEIAPLMQRASQGLPLTHGAPSLRPGASAIGARRPFKVW